MEAEIVKVEQLDEVISKSGLAIQQGEDVKRSYMPFLDEIASIQEESKKINFNNPSETDEKIARDLRLRMVKQRTGAKDLKDSRKAIYIRLGDVEQKSYNLIESTAKLAEEVLMQVEKRREIAEKKRKEELRIERLVILSQFVDNSEIYPVENMDEAAFQDLAEGLKSAKIKREKEEADRIKVEEELKVKNETFNARRLMLSKMVAYTGEEILQELTLETTEEEFKTIIEFCNGAKEKFEQKQEQLRVENERIKAQQEKERKEKEAELEAQRLVAQKEKEEAIEEMKRAEAEKVYRQNEMIKMGLRFNGEEFCYKDINYHWTEIIEMPSPKFVAIINLIRERMAQIKLEEEEADKKLKAAQEKADKEKKELEAKLKAQEDEKKRLAQIEADKEKARQEVLKQANLAPDKDKLEKWIESFEIPTIPTMSTDEYRNKIDFILSKFNGFKKWALTQL